MNIKIEPKVLDVLKRSHVNGNALKLPEQLERKLYLATDKILGVLGGQWNRSKQAHLFEGDAGELVEAAVMTGEVTDYKKLYQFYETPDGLADSMVHMADMKRSHTVLEPSAGHGAIIRGIQREFPDKLVAFCEIDKSKHGRLPSGSVPLSLVQDDFMLIEPRPEYDRIIANPPFRNGQDCQHILRMFDWLKPRGKIVSVCSPGWQYRENGVWFKFRTWLKEVDHEVDELPEGTFKASGTNVRSMLITINR